MQKDLKTLFGEIHGLDEKSLNFLVKALEKNNIPGFDYIEFKQSLGNLMAMDMSEETAFKSVYATAVAVGLTKEKLLKSAVHYKQILNKEKDQFDAALQKQMVQRVEGKLKEVEKLKSQIVEYHKKIAELEARIDKAQNTIDNADGQITDAKSKIQAREEAFQFTYQSVFNQIDQDIENIQQYL
jgi:chromosome segregation ATPase